jgi:predicted ATPase
MSDLVGPVQFEASLVPRTDLATLHVRSSTTEDWFLPTNVGFGISYALPIVIAGLATKAGTQLIVDSPEAHLHPAAQSALGAFLARVAACGVQVLVETHSDHILNGIRRAVVGQLIQHSDVVIHFLTGTQPPAEIGIDERGRLDEWPAGFFDQLEIDLRMITKPIPRP